MIRRIDDLGRVVIPKEIRKDLDIREGDPLEVCIYGDGVLLTKHRELCTYCRVEISADSDLPFCDKCLDKLRRG